MTTTTTTTADADRALDQACRLLRLADRFSAECADADPEATALITAAAAMLGAAARTRIKTDGPADRALVDAALDAIEIDQSRWAPRTATHEGRRAMTRDTDTMTWVTDPADMGITDPDEQDDYLRAVKKELGRGWTTRRPHTDTGITDAVIDADGRHLLDADLVAHAADAADRAWNQWCE